MYSPRRSGWTQKARPSLIDMKETLLRIVINTFMLERGPYLTEFINRVTKLNNGSCSGVSPTRPAFRQVVDRPSGEFA